MVDPVPLSTAEIVFKREFNSIRLPEMHTFVREVFDKFCPAYFWTAPASSSGKYHPRIAQGHGGIVRHTQLAVWWGRELCQAIPPTQEQIVTAALLLHDLWKFGREYSGTGKPTETDITKTHGGLLADAIREEYNLFSNIRDDRNQRTYLMEGSNPLWMYQIAFAIGGHMGMWTHAKYSHYLPKLLGDPDWRRISQVVHLADFAASRRTEDALAYITYGLTPPPAKGPRQ